MARSYESQTNANDGITRTTEYDTESPVDPSMLGVMAVLGFILFVVVMVAQAIYTSTGTNVFDSLDGITGPCNHCTTEEGN